MKTYIQLISLSVSFFAYTLVSTPPGACDLTIKSHYGAGFFAELNKVVDNIMHFSDKRLSRIQVDWSDNFFLYKNSRTENGWDLYFEPIAPDTREAFEAEQVTKEVSGKYYHALHDFLCIDHWVNYDAYLAYRMEVHEVVNKYIKVKRHILDKVEHIVKTELDDHYCIGVHIRYGSDHAAEAPKGTPTLEDYSTEIAALIKQNAGKKVKIYLATDSHYVVKFLKIRFPGSVLTIDTCRSQGEEVPHLVYGNGDYWRAHEEEFHQKKPGYIGGEGVLMDVLLLAKCDALVHTTSNIASFATFLNPTIRSVYLPKSQITWPCRHGLK